MTKQSWLLTIVAVILAVAILAWSPLHPQPSPLPIVCDGKNPCAIPSPLPTLGGIECHQEKGKPCEVVPWTHETNPPKAVTSPCPQGRICHLKNGKPVVIPSMESEIDDYCKEHHAGTGVGYLIIAGVDGDTYSVGDVVINCESADFEFDHETGKVKRIDHFPDDTPGEST